MKKIKVITDQNFPYDIHAFNHEKIFVKKIIPLSGLPKPLASIAHLLTLYRSAFYHDIILGNRRSVLLLGLLFMLYQPKRVTLIGYEMIFNFKDNFRNKAVIFLWRVAVQRINFLVVQTTNEVKLLSQKFRAPLSKFVFIPFYAENGPYQGPGPKDYIFSAGRMERDFITLLKAVRGTDIPVIIVADPALEDALQPYATPQTQFYFNIPKEDYLAMLNNARLVVISLKKGGSSRGQVVMLEAMKIGKPTIVSRVEGIVEYVRDGYTGWLVEPEHPAMLRELLLKYYHDTAKLEQIGRQAQQVQRSRYSEEAYVRQYHQLLLNACKGQPLPPTQTVLDSESV